MQGVEEVPTTTPTALAVRAASLRPLVLSVATSLFSAFADAPAAALRQWSPLLAAVLWWAAPPFEPWQAALVGFVVAVMGFAGGMTMSAIKRDRGVKDYGTLVVGHGGVLDRVDSMCFAAPVFYHLTMLVVGHHPG
jgi:CDP-diglyceride synthetase